MVDRTASSFSGKGAGAKVNGDLEVTGSITPTGAKGQKEGVVQ